MTTPPRSSRNHKESEVLDAAELLFQKQGYESTKIEAIAVEASVASATVYNYFETKNNIFLSIILRHLEAALPERRRFMRALPDYPVAGIIAFENMLAEQALRFLGRDSWKIILTAKLLDDQSAAYRTARRLDTLIYKQYIRILTRYRNMGRIRDDVDIALLASLLIDVGNAILARIVVSAHTVAEGMKLWGDPSVRMVLRGLIVEPEDTAA